MIHIQNVFLILLLMSSCASPPKTASEASQTSTQSSTSKGPHYIGDPEYHTVSTKPAFATKGPRLCFDAGHNNLAVAHGFYKPVLGLLASDGIHVEVLHERFSSKKLKDCDLLYTSAARGHPDIAQKKLAALSAFSKNEIKAIHKWVSSGGGIYISPDHRPMADAMQPLLDAFGVKGSLINVENPKKPVPPFTEPGIFEISDQQLNPTSPIISGRNTDEQIKKIYFFYGEALRPARKDDILLAAGIDTQLRNNEEGFEIVNYPALAVAFKFKKGRVVIAGDGTVFTSKVDTTINEKTGINRPGSDNVQFALNVFRWLAKLY